MPAESIFFLWLAFWLVPLSGIADAVVKPDIAWKDLNKDKTVWVLIQIFLGIIGSIFYLVSVRPKLKRAAKYHEHP